MPDGVYVPSNLAGSAILTCMAAFALVIYELPGLLKHGFWGRALLVVAGPVLAIAAANLPVVPSFAWGLAAAGYVAVGLAWIMRFQVRCPHCSTPLRRNEHIQVNFNGTPFKTFTAYCPACRWSTSGKDYLVDPGEGYRQEMQRPLPGLEDFHEGVSKALCAAQAQFPRAGVSAHDFREFSDQRRGKGEYGPMPIPQQMDHLSEYLTAHGISRLS